MNFETGDRVSFDRVVYEGPRAEKIVKDVDNTTDILRQIVAFSTVVVDAVGARGGHVVATANPQSHLRVDSFSSIVHNQIQQLLLGAKADAVADLAIAATKNGEKPVVTLQLTMESYIDKLATDKGIATGDKFDGTFRDVLQIALDRTLRVTETLPNGQKIPHVLTAEDLGLEREYNEILQQISAMAVDVPASPIDYIKWKMRRAGVTVCEVTGRGLYLEYQDDGKTAILRQRTNKERNDKNAPVNGFNGGRFDAMILNASGSIGISLHASENVKDQRPRRMIIAQAALDINVFKQTLGRIYRSGMIPGG
jgi:hypothetical protein